MEDVCDNCLVRTGYTARDDDKEENSIVDLWCSNRCKTRQEKNAAHLKQADSAYNPHIMERKRKTFGMALCAQSKHSSFLRALKACKPCILGQKLLSYPSLYDRMVEKTQPELNNLIKDSDFFG